MKRLKNTLAAAGAVAAVVGGATVADVAAADQAQASHNYDTAIYVSTNSMDARLSFRQNNGVQFGVSRGTTACCYAGGQVYVAAGRDVAMNISGVRYVLRDTGWRNFPDRDGVHITFTSIPG